MNDHYIFVTTWYDRKDTGDTRAFTTHAAALQHKRMVALEYGAADELGRDPTDTEISDWWDRQFPDMAFNIDEIPLETPEN